MNDPAVRDDLRVARLHLRTGALALALAELEELDGRDALDAASRADLAEARWRLGDPDGAAAAARVHVDGGGSDPVAIAILAEAAARSGDAPESAALVARLAELDPVSLDRIFAGLPRHALWPGHGSDVPPGAGSAPPGSPDDDDPGGHGTPGRSGRDRGTRRRELAGSPADLELARRDVTADPGAAALRLALALRVEPGLAPAVLAVIGTAAEPELALVRGDALRLLGRHADAEAAYAAARTAIDRSNRPNRGTRP